jgi:hypothetical protein
MATKPNIVVELCDVGSILPPTSFATSKS